MYTMYADVCWRMLTYVCILCSTHSIRMHTIVCWRMLTYADVCWRMLTYADVCWRMLTYTDVCCSIEWSAAAVLGVSSPWRAREPVLFFLFFPLYFFILFFCLYTHALSLAMTSQRAGTFSFFFFFFPVFQDFFPPPLYTHAARRGWTYSMHMLHATAVGSRLSVSVQHIHMLYQCSIYISISAACIHMLHSTRAHISSYSRYADSDVCWRMLW
jgi:hypothetical protein